MVTIGFHPCQIWCEQALNYCRMAAHPIFRGKKWGECATGHLIPDPRCRRTSRYAVLPRAGLRRSSSCVPFSATGSEHYNSVRLADDFGSDGARAIPDMQACQPCRRPKLTSEWQPADEERLISEVCVFPAASSPNHAHHRVLASAVAFVARWPSARCPVHPMLSTRPCARPAHSAQSAHHPPPPKCHSLFHSCPGRPVPSLACVSSLSLCEVAPALRWRVVPAATTAAL
jgi:hypothetical protein